MWCVMAQLYIPYRYCTVKPKHQRWECHARRILYFRSITRHIILYHLSEHCVKLRSFPDQALIRISVMRVSILYLILSLVYVDAFSSMTSAFGGRVLLLSTSCQTENPRTHGSHLEMKKGKSNVPAHMRGQYKRMEELSKMREQMMEAQRPGSDGLPVFNLYVRTPRANVSYFYCYRHHWIWK